MVKIVEITDDIAAAAPSNQAYTVEQAENELDEWQFLEYVFKSVLAGASTKTTGFSFELLYRKVVTMTLINKRGRQLYEGVRALVSDYIKQLVVELRQRPENADNNANFVMQFDLIWNKFSETMEEFTSILMYHERVYVTHEDEPIKDFGWRVFRTEVFEDEVVKARLLEKPEDYPVQKKARMESDSEKVFQIEPIFVESPVVSADVILDIMGFLEIPEIGLKLALVSRQLVFLTDYFLNRRKHILAPLMLLQHNDQYGPEEENGLGLANANACMVTVGRVETDGNNPTSKVRQIMFVLESSAVRLAVPKIVPPKWIVGPELLYLNDGLNDELLAFLYTIRRQLQHCRLTFNFCMLWNRLRETRELYGPFMSLFNECCFAITHADVPDLYYDSCALNPTEKMEVLWPLWAVFNSIFFSQCRELHLHMDFLESPQIGLEAAKWLHHPSTEKEPRKLKLYSDNGRWANFIYFHARGMSSLLKAVKENFQLAHEKRTFYIELPNDGLSDEDCVELVNEITTEQLLILPLSIRRVPSVLGRVKLFEECYPHLMMSKGPAPTEVVISTRCKWLKTPSNAAKHSDNDDPQAI